MSGLRSPRPSATSPPPPRNSNKTIPLRAQPLLHQTADRRLSSALHTALNNIAPSEQDRNSMLKKVKLVKSQSATPRPRKRQKFNLENYKRVQALSTMVRADPPEEHGESARKKKRKRSRNDDAGRGGAFSPTQNALRLRASIDTSTSPTAKKPRKVKAMKREAASENVLASPSPILRLAHPPVQRRSLSVSDVSVPATSDRHRTVIELSERRRRSLSDASHLAPVMLPSIPVSAVRTGVDGTVARADDGGHEEADDEFEEVEVRATVKEDDELDAWDVPVAEPNAAWPGPRARHGRDVEDDEEDEDELFGVDVEAPTRPPSPSLRQPSPAHPSPSFTAVQPYLLASRRPQEPFESRDRLPQSPVTPSRPRLERSIPFTPVSPQLFNALDPLQLSIRRPNPTVDGSPTPAVRTTPPASSSSESASSLTSLAQRLRETFAAAAVDPGSANNLGEEGCIKDGEHVGSGATRTGGAEEQV